MKSRINLLTLASAAVFLVGTVTYGDTFQENTLTGSEYLWSTNANWVDGSRPTAGDEAIIPDGTTCHIADAFAVADRITVQGTGELNIKASSKLTLDSDVATSQVSAVGSTINLLGSGSELAFISSSPTLSGSGIVDGHDPAALISVATGITLTSSTNITGELEINGLGGFTNEGVVEANNADGTLKLAMTGTLDDFSTTADRWIVSANGAKLHFDAAIGTLNALDGNFVMTEGNAFSRIIFDHELTSDGRLEMAFGVLEVNQDVTMGDDFSQFMELTGGVIEVGAGMEFGHN